MGHCFSNKNQEFDFEKLSQLYQNQSLSFKRNSQPVSFHNKVMKKQRSSSYFHSSQKKNHFFLNSKTAQKSSSKISEIHYVSIGLASSQTIRKWAEKKLPNGKILGEVTSANTLHHKTFKPLKGGLFCERIFGPLRDFECACGIQKRPNSEDYQKIIEHKKIQRKFCPTCDVEYTWSILRRYQLGYIQLVSPVSHVWYLKANPSYLSILLDFKKSQLEKIIYCTETLTLEKSLKSSSTRVQESFEQNFAQKDQAEAPLNFEESASDVFLAWQKSLQMPKGSKWQKTDPSLLQIARSVTSKMDSKLEKANYEKYFPLFPIQNLRKQFEKIKRSSFICSNSMNLYLEKIKEEPYLFETNSPLSVVFQKNFQTFQHAQNQVQQMDFFLWKIFYEFIQKPLKNKQDWASCSLNVEFVKTFLFLFETIFIHSKKSTSNKKYFYRLFILLKKLEHLKMALKSEEQIRSSMVLWFGFDFETPGFERNFEMPFQEMKPLNSNEPSVKPFVTKIFQLSFQKFYQSTFMDPNQSKTVFENPMKWTQEISTNQRELIYKISSQFQASADKFLKNQFPTFLNQGSFHQKDRFRLEFQQNLDMINKSVDLKFPSILFEKNPLMETFLLKTFYWNSWKIAYKDLFFSDIENWKEEFQRIDQKEELDPVFLKSNQIPSQIWKSKSHFNKNPSIHVYYLWVEFRSFVNNATVSLKTSQGFFEKLWDWKNGYFLSSFISEFDSSFVKNETKKSKNFQNKILKLKVKFENENQIPNFGRDSLLKGLSNDLPKKSRNLLKKQVFAKFYKSHKSLDSKDLEPKKILKIQVKQVVEFPLETSEIERFNLPVSQNKLIKPSFKNDKQNYSLYLTHLKTGSQRFPSLKTLKNSIYCLSYKELWNQETGWQYFSYYSLAPRKFEDLSMPVYKRRGFECFNQEKTRMVQTGAEFVQNLLFEFNTKELQKMDRQNRLFLYDFNKKISILKTFVRKMSSEKSEIKKLKDLCKKRDQLISKTKLIRKLFLKQSSPTDMILTTLPVLPPDLRPILKMQDQIAASDLNRLYQRILYRNDRLKKFRKNRTLIDSFPVKFSQKLLQEAVDNLIQNGKGGVTPERDARGRALKSLSEILKGKQGRFRQYLLGKRVDYSGRSVIVVGPKLKIHECGLPKEIALELFLPFLIQRILHYKLARTVIGAKSFIQSTNPSESNLCSFLLAELMQSHPILLNRAPTLHRLGFQAFQPKLIEGRTILLHPLVCPAFNADFDGDQMAVHLPLTVEARTESWKLMFARNHLISAATGDPILLPSQDMVLGCYYLTNEVLKFSFLADSLNKKKETSEKLQGILEVYEKMESKLWKEDWTKKQKTQNIFMRYFNNFDQVLKAYQRQILSTHSDIWVRWEEPVETTSTKYCLPHSSPIEIRLSSDGSWKEIRLKQIRQFDLISNLKSKISREKGNMGTMQNVTRIHQYIRTTPGRIQFHHVVTGCMKEK